MAINFKYVSCNLSRIIRPKYPKQLRFFPSFFTKSRTLAKKIGVMGIDNLDNSLCFLEKVFEVLIPRLLNANVYFKSVFLQQILD